MKKRITLLIRVVIVVLVLLNFNECKKENPGEPSNISYISGTYKAEYSYHFDCTSFSCDISGSSQPHQALQNGNNISVGSCQGTINENNIVQFKGCLISYGGIQEFTGTYNPSLKKISGTFTGTTCEGGPYGTGRYDGSVSNGLFTLTKSDSTTPPVEPPPSNPDVSQFFFNCTEGSFHVEGNLESSLNGTGIDWLDDSTIIAYNFNSLPVISAAQLSFEGTPTVGSYNFNYLSSGKKAFLIWMLNVNMNDTTEIYSKTCMLNSGTVNITSLNSKNLTATFQGSGNFAQNYQQTTQVTNGTVNLVGLGKSKNNNNIPIKIRKIIESISNKIKKGK